MMRCLSVFAFAFTAIAASVPSFEATDPSRRISHKYIVKLKNTVSSSVRDKALETLSATADFVYDSGIFNGFAVTLDNGELGRLRNHPDVSQAVYTSFDLDWLDVNRALLIIMSSG